ncbi:MAG: PD-(D/E)XK nuclease family protein, partial [Deltaproteobacteria bacterium]|nr:PD-(D/E)XK nuclease family protein [Deltaproteobacteria bacterium]
FYVAVTRAKEALYMSGIAKVKDDDTLTAGKKNVLEWVMEHDGIDGAAIEDVSAERDIAIEIDPISPSLPPDETASETVLPEQYDLHPQRSAYTMAKSPSSFAEDILRAEGKLSGDEASFNRARGTVTHAILNTAIRGRKLPTVAAVARALEAGGIGQDRADKTAPEILKEAEKTLTDPFVARLTAISAIKNEWEIEDTPAEGRVRSGVIDLAALDGDTWWICDFKTSRPEDDQPVEEFVAQEKDLYRPQLEAYKEMLAHLKNVPESKIQTGIYLTALLRWEEF